MPSILDIFPERISVSEEDARFVPRTKCWLWKGPYNQHGYGQALTFNGKRWSNTHRLSYYLSNDIDPKRNFVCHTCDNKACVNPEHLFLGDAQLNASDKIKWETQLSLEDLKNIKDSKYPAYILAKKYHLSTKQIERIRPPWLYGDKNKGRKIFSYQLQERR